ncbi:MAG: Hsp33 family molecular chaperone HslO [Thermoclostridium sp.]|nr:Hsp33 family molecular chaperone HslO [Thermoclostridium sp.]
MNDYMLRAITKDGMVRIYAALTTQTVEEAKNIHQMNPTPSVALGRTLTAAALMAGTLKDTNSTITIQIKGDGPIGGILAVTDAQSNVRGYVDNPWFDLPINERGKFDIAGAVGKGYLNVITDLGLKEPYIGRVDLVSGEIAEDITFYYAHSEQTPTVTSLGVLVGREGKIINAGGLFIQLMPNCDDQTISWLEGCIEKMPPITRLLDGSSLEDILKEVLDGRELVFLDTRPVTYRCNCSRQRMERNLLSLGLKDLEELAREQDETELVCHFCETKYRFPSAEIQDMIEALKS